MATIINEIVTANSKGEVSFKFSLNNEKTLITIQNYFEKNDATDIYVEIPISEWQQVVKYINLTLIKS